MALIAMDSLAKSRYRIFGLSLFAALSFWVLDALVDYLMLYDEPFWAVLVGNEEELLFRIFFSICFLLFGVFMATSFSKQKRVELDLKHQISERLLAEENMRNSEARYRSLIESVTDNIYLINRHCRYLFANQRYLDRTGLLEAQLQERSYADLHDADETALFTDKVRIVLESGVPLHYEHLSGRDSRYFLRTLSPVKNSRGEIEAVTVVSKDISDLKLTEKKMRQLAMTDELTGLYNRRGFFMTCEQHRKIAKRQKRRMGLLYIDLDNLKEINDRLGHAAGDQALVDTASILRSSYRESDIIARIGGDEFVVMPTGESTSNEVVILEHLAETIRRHNAREDLRFPLSMSCGMAWHDPEKEDSIDVLLHQAEQNMYHQKSGKKAGWPQLRFRG